MTDNEIIKALEWLERLKRDTDVSEWAESLKIILNEYNRKKAEIERLKKFIEKDQGLILKLTNVPKNEYDNKIKSEAIKEFADRLKNCFAISGDYLDIINIIDNLVKEITG